MVAYCKTTRCLRGVLLEYFGEHHPGKCGNCGNCCGDFVETDITTEAQKILSGLARIQKRWPGGLGVVALVQMLRGAGSETPWTAGWTSSRPMASCGTCRPSAMRLYLDALRGAGLPGCQPATSTRCIAAGAAKAPARCCSAARTGHHAPSAAATAQETQAGAVLPAKARLPRAALPEADDSLLDQPEGPAQPAGPAAATCPRI
ncbi:MAG: RecQ family zinc-binding domain-containing protein [Subdoligranulum sp.]